MPAFNSSGFTDQGGAGVRQAISLFQPQSTPGTRRSQYNAYAQPAARQPAPSEAVSKQQPSAAPPTAQSATPDSRARAMAESRQQIQSKYGANAYTGIHQNAREGTWTQYFDKTGKAPPASANSDHYDANGNLVRIGADRRGGGGYGSFEINRGRENEVRDFNQRLATLGKGMSEHDILRTLSYDNNAYALWQKQTYGDLRRPELNRIADEQDVRRGLRRPTDPGTARPIQ